MSGDLSGGDTICLVYIKVYQIFITKLTSGIYY